MRDLWTTIQADHDLLWRFTNQLTGGPGGPIGGPGEQQKIAKQLVAAASRHEAAEELVLWPVVRKCCPDGEELAGEVVHQELEGKRAFNELEHVSAGTAEFAECVNTVAGMLRLHVSYEQSQVWPRLADQLSPSEAEDLADKWLAARRTGPTRPHPLTPAKPGILASVGPVVAVMDRARDLLTGRPVPDA